MSIVSQLKHSGLKLSGSSWKGFLNYLKATPSKGLYLFSFIFFFFRKKDRLLMEVYMGTDWGDSVNDLVLLWNVTWLPGGIRSNMV